MRICALIKYPPIQGGVSARSFWLSRGLARLGHEVYVVSHADLVEDSYRIEMSEEDRAWCGHEPGGAGLVRLVEPQRDSRRYVHIPQSPMHTERLAALAAQTVRAQRCDIIVSYYFQPFGVAAHLTSQWTGVPHTVQHAGSDLGRLMNQPDVFTTYREIITRADAVLSGSPRCFVGMGVRPARIHRPPRFLLPSDCFHPEATPLDLRAHIRTIDSCREGNAPAEAFDPELPTVGIYGKLGEPKGSYDLLAALSMLHREGRRFNFVAMTQGRELARYRQAIVEHGLAGCTWLLPFVPHHRVPAFIRACDVVTFLERDFPITFHAPTVPSEVFACGTCLVLSREIADKQLYREQLRTNENVVIVDDPRHHEELADALRGTLGDRERSRAIGRRGSTIDGLVGPLEDYARGYEEILEDVLRVRRGEPSRLPLSDRSFPADRAAALKELTYPLWAAYGDRMTELLPRYLELEIEPEGTPYDDAARLCRFLEETSASDSPPAGWSETLRLTGNIVWLGQWNDEEALVGPFSQRDTRDLGEGRWLETAPLRTSWLRIERFMQLPPSVPWREADGRALLAFHKQPNMRGNVFKINEWTCHLLERSDGRVSCSTIIAELADGRMDPSAAAAAVKRALRWWYTRGLVTFVDPVVE